ncbi:hypothetical protein [Terrisporobacter sp.]|uniref:hypothetical protein n=1 Tax=Terrisporobacter sp. TaxID=1965305 RepID=UPI002623E76D|nr:hypothetical protein [Terrisporobacter sp.]
MKVKDLIDKLKQFDENKDVVIFDIDDFYSDIINIEEVLKLSNIGYGGYECTPIDDEDTFESNDITFVALYSNFDL